MNSLAFNLQRAVLVGHAYSWDCFKSNPILKNHDDGDDDNDGDYDYDDYGRGDYDDDDVMTTTEAAGSYETSVCSRFHSITIS